jgi:hypothetical protein
MRCLRHQHPKSDTFDREEMDVVLTYLAGHHDEQVQLGHATTAMLLQKYSSWIDGGALVAGRAS